MILEYVSGKQSTSVIYRNIEKDVDQYRLPEFDWEDHIEDFYSIVQLRVAYHQDKYWNPLYRVCKPMDFGDYNIRPARNTRVEDENWVERLKQRGWSQKWGPYVWGRISEINPRYIFVPKFEDWVYHADIKIFPTPTEDVNMGLTLTYNFVQQPVEYNDAFSTNSVDLATLNLPWYFLDAIEDYITFRLYQAENPEMAQWYYSQFENALHDNIYGLNKDKRPVDEWFANTSYFSHY